MPGDNLQLETRLNSNAKPVGPSRLPGNLRWGISWGLFYATCLSIFVGLMAVLRGSTVYEDFGGLTTWQAAAFYYGAGITGGAVAGLLRPVQQHYWGKYFTAYLILFLVYGGCTVVVFLMMAERYPGLPLKFVLFLWAILCLGLAPIHLRFYRD